MRECHFLIVYRPVAQTTTLGENNELSNPQRILRLRILHEVSIFRTRFVETTL